MVIFPVYDFTILYPHSSSLSLLLMYHTLTSTLSLCTVPPVEMLSVQRRPCSHKRARLHSSAFSAQAQGFKGDILDTKYVKEQYAPECN